MSTDRLTEDEAVAFGRRLDTFAAGLTSPERTLLSAILRDAEVAPYDAIDRRTPGDIVVAIHQTHRSPPISLNPLPIPPGPPASPRPSVTASETSSFRLEAACNEPHFAPRSDTMNSTPDHVQQHAPPTQDASGPPPGKSGSGLPSAFRLERVQQYLAPLERFGNQKVAWIGSILLFVGIFLPTKAASIPFANITVSASFWDFSKFESFLLVLFALASSGLAYIRDYKWLWATGAGSLFFLAIEFFNTLTQSYLHASWGWLILFGGVALILAAGTMRPNPRETSRDAATVVGDLVRRMSGPR